MKLSLVATPIGNLEDITLRAIRILGEADFVICEDTRHSRKLLKHYDIENELVSFHSKSSPEKVTAIIERIKNGEHAALISDAGTPGISDPGYAIIQAAIAEDVQIETLPGACAAISGLIGSGMHMHHFLYLGFLPLKKGRQTLFLSLQEKRHTVVIYESPHRILKTLGDIEKYFGPDHEICIARELTKIHETYHRGTVSELIELGNNQGYKGEIVVVF